VGDVWLARPQVSEAEVAAERGRLESDLVKATKELEGVKGRLDDPRFAERAPETVVARTRAQADELTEKVRRLNERLRELAG